MQNLPRDDTNGKANALDALVEVIADRVADRLAQQLRRSEQAPAPLLSAVVLAEALGVSPDTIARLAPPHVQIGSRRRYDLGEVRAWLASRPTTPTVREAAPVRKTRGAR